MYIRKTKIKNKNDYMVYLVEGYRDQRGKTMQRIIKRYGSYNELTKNNPQAFEQLKERYQTNLEETKINLELDLLKVRDGSQKLQNYGYVFLESIYNQLSISTFIDEYAENKTFKYNLNDIFKLLVFSRCLNPASKRETYHHKDSYFLNLSDFSQDDIYRSLNHLTQMKDDLMIHLNQEIIHQGLRDVSLVFYDVTNYYFESEATSELMGKGVSKERVKSSIVQMGLFIDNNGLPITYELFNGSTNDLSTMRPILEKIKKDYNLGSITIVGDKGNNSSSNLAMIEDYHDKYIIAQKIRGRGSLMADIVLDQAGYIYNHDQSFKHKFETIEKEVTDLNGNKRILTQRLMCFWSKNEEIYQKNKRGLLDEKIEKYLDNPALLNASNAFGIKKYFKSVKVDQSGQVIKGKNTYQFNQEKYERDLALDGYYVIVTNDLTLSPFDIIKNYRQLSKIEDSFRVTKTDLEGRPIYVWTDNHIKGHFLTCYLSLLIYRLLQLKLDNQYSVNQIKKALNEANVMGIGSGIIAFTETNEIVDELSKLHNIDIGYQKMKIEHFKRKLKLI